MVTQYYTRITFLTRPIRYVIHFLQRPVIDTDIDTIVNAEVLSKTCLGAFSNPLEHLVTIGSSLRLPYHFKYIFKRLFFSELW